MKRVHPVDTNLAIIAALIFIMLCTACWIWIRPTGSLREPDNRAAQTERQNP